MTDSHFDPVSLRRQIVAGDIAQGEAVLSILANGATTAPIEELRGLIAYRRGKTLVALDHADRAIALDETLIAAHLLRIKALSRLGRHTAAAEGADTLLSIESDDNEVLSTTAKVYQKAKIHDSAARAWLKLAERRPDDVTARTRAIETLELAGDYCAAIGQSLALCDSGAASVDICERCLLMALRWGAPLEVERALRALADADLDKALENLTDLAVAGRFADAEWVLERAAEAGATIHPALAVSLGRSIVSQAKDAEQRGDMLEAVAAWSLVQAIGVDDRAAPRLEKAGIAVSKYAAALAVQGKAKEADVQMDVLLRAWPTARAWSVKATIAKAREHWDALGRAYGELAILANGAERGDAIGRTIRALRKSKDFAATLATLTRMAEAIGPHAELDDAGAWAFDKLRRQVRDQLKAGDAVAADTGYHALAAWNAQNEELPALATKLQKAHAAEMNSARRADNAPAAVAPARRLIELVPDRLDALKFLADHNLKSGLHADAAKFYERLLVLAPDDHRYFYKIGRAYRSTGDYARATEMLRRFLAVESQHKAARDLLNEIAARQGD